MDDDKTDPKLLSFDEQMKKIADKYLEDNYTIKNYFPFVATDPAWAGSGTTIVKFTDNQFNTQTVPNPQVMPEVIKKCTCGTSIAMGKDDHLSYHSDWCELLEDKKK